MKRCTLLVGTNEYKGLNPMPYVEVTQAGAHRSARGTRRPLFRNRRRSHTLFPKSANSILDSAFARVVRAGAFMGTRGSKGRHYARMSIVR